MKFERQMKRWGENSLVVTIPIDLVKYLGLKPYDPVIIQDEEGKHGKYITVWKKGE